jgi:hypothetical protein
MFLYFEHKVNAGGFSLGSGVMRIPDAVLPHVPRLLEQGHARAATDAEIAAAYPGEPKPAAAPAPAPEPDPSLVPNTSPTSTFDGGYF